MGVKIPKYTTVRVTATTKKQIKTLKAWLKKNIWPEFSRISDDSVIVWAIKRAKKKRKD